MVTLNTGAAFSVISEETYRSTFTDTKLRKLNVLLNFLFFLGAATIGAAQVLWATFSMLPFASSRSISSLIAVLMANGTGHCESG